MRVRYKVLLSLVILVGVQALGPASASAGESCQAGSHTVSTDGPTVVGGETKITYMVSGSHQADHVATVVSSGSTNCSTPTIVSVTGSPLSGSQAYGPAVGDPITGLGRLSCHDEAVKVNPNGSVVSFTITVAGTRAAAPKTVVVKKGKSVGLCEIVGIGDPGAPEQVAPVTEIIKEPGSNCAVEFTKDQISGKVLDAQITGDSHPDCELHQTPATSLKLEVDSAIGTCSTPPCSLGTAKFGEGYVHSGSNSCTTRIIGGRVYSWGAPCPE